jgi:hypothetical protein
MDPRRVLLIPCERCMTPVPIRTRDGAQWVCADCATQSRALLLAQGQLPFADEGV